jgi:predicted nucleic acid-binding protein
LSRENEPGSGRKRLRVFVDANTIVSGLVFEGNEALLLRLGAIRLCTLVTTQYVMDEVKQALRAKEFGLTEDEVETSITLAYKCMTVHKGPNQDQLHRYSSRLDDKKDLHVLASFEGLDCDMLVTGDRELLGKVNGARTTRQAIKTLLS